MGAAKHLISLLHFLCLCPSQLVINIWTGVQTIFCFAFLSQQNYGLRESKEMRERIGSVQRLRGKEWAPSSGTNSQSMVCSGMHGAASDVQELSAASHSFLCGRFLLLVSGCLLSGSPAMHFLSVTLSDWRYESKWTVKSWLPKCHSHK